MTNHLHHGDLPDGLDLGPVVAIDSETMGSTPIATGCVVQLSAGNGDAHLVQFARGQYNAPNLAAPLTDPDRLKLFHFARFDIAVMRLYLGVVTQPVYCTKIAARLVRTYTDRYGLNTCAASCWASRSPNSSNPPTGAPIRSPMSRLPTPQPTCCTCTN